MHPQRTIAESARTVIATEQGEARDDVFLRLAAVTERTGLSRSTIYRMVTRSEFPAQVKLGRRAVGWRRSEIDCWSWSRSGVDR